MRFRDFVILSENFLEAVLPVLSNSKLSQDEHYLWCNIVLEVASLAANINIHKHDWERPVNLKLLGNIYRQVAEIIRKKPADN